MARHNANLADYGSTATKDRLLFYGTSLDQSDYIEEEFENNLPPARRFRRRTDEIQAEDTAIEREILAARSILGMAADEDDDDFVTYQDETLQRAISFLRRMAVHAHACGFSGIGVPRIIPGDKGAISLFWSGDRELLMTFPSEEHTPVSYFARKGLREQGGRFPSNDFIPELIYWLTN